jgi:uncharacterized membrane protein YraQ (UPF0718 family)
MKEEKTVESGRETKNSFRYMYIFPLVVMAVYVVLFIIIPDKALEALKSSGQISLNILLPLVMVFVVTLVLNLFIKPVQIVRLLGSRKNIKGILLSIVAGLISMGPIYVWYPMLKDLKEKGAGNMHIAVFLYNRAVKPVLLPVMIAYFGWIYVVILTLVTVAASVVNGYLVDIFTGNKAK